MGKACGHGTLRASRTWAQPARWAARVSPPKKRVIARWGVEGDVDEKIDGPERAAGAHVGLGGVVFETAQVLVISPITGAA